jgi:hypothetical protein
MKRLMFWSAILGFTLALTGICAAQQSKFLQELGKAVLGVNAAALTVESEPAGAEVYLDNVKVGVTPLTLQNLQPGDKVVRLEKEGFESRERQVTLKAGEKYGLRIVLPAKETEAQAGQSRLYVSTSPPDARVRILNIKPPYEAGMALDPGSYHIEVAKEGYETFDKWIELEPGRDKEISVELKQIGAAAPAAKKEEPYDIMACHSGTITVFSEDGENVIFQTEYQGVTNSRLDNGVFGDNQYRCVGIGSVTDGEEMVHGYCERKDSDGDSYTLEFSGTRAEGTTNFLFGTGKWQGIQGEGQYQRTTNGKPISAGSFQECISEKGTVVRSD